MSSRAEIESLRKANEMGFLEDVIMDPVDSFEGGVEIQAQFIAPIDAKKKDSCWGFFVFAHDQG